MKKVVIGLYALVGAAVLLFLSSTSGEREEPLQEDSQNFKQELSHTQFQTAYKQSEQPFAFQQETSEKPTQGNNLKEGNNLTEGKDMKLDGASNYWLKRQEFLMERQRKLEQYKQSPEYKAMQKWKEEYRAWREKIIKQMQDAYEAGDWQKLNELKMKLVRKEGAPPKPHIGLSKENYNKD